MDNILSFAAFKSQKELKKSDGAKRSRLIGGGPAPAKPTSTRQLALARRKSPPPFSLPRWQPHGPAGTTRLREGLISPVSLVVIGHRLQASPWSSRHKTAQAFVPAPLMGRPPRRRRPCRAGIAKLTDANDAGTRGSGACTLILTEGDSAKTLAMSGMSVVGHDRWGVFPLRRAGAALGGGKGPAIIPTKGRWNCSSGRRARGIGEGKAREWFGGARPVCAAASALPSRTAPPSPLSPGGSCSTCATRRPARSARTWRSRTSSRRAPIPSLFINGCPPRPLVGAPLNPGPSAIRRASPA
jgi:hypothetical protein